MPITAEEFLNVLAILESIDEVPGMPDGGMQVRMRYKKSGNVLMTRLGHFQSDPVQFLRRADDATRAAIWAVVEKRLGKGE